MARGRAARDHHDGVSVLPARNAVATVFVLNGFGFATLFSRVPDLREGLALDNAGLGLLLLAAALGSVLALPAAGELIRRSSAAAVVRGGGVLAAVGLLGVGTGVGAIGSVVPTAAGLFVYGVGTGIWDVAMNVEGAAVERGLARSVMPRFHAGWSLGSVAGAGVGVLVIAVDIPLVAHLALASFLSLVVLRVTRAFLPVEPEARTRSSAASWGEPRTLALGLLVLAFALTEGAANDWLALALIDGHHVERWVGVAGFAGFVVAMTTGRLTGTVLLDRFGRVAVLRATAMVALAGLLLLVLGQHPVVVGLGVVLWGLGASLGFPVGMSAAADDPAHAAARVSVVSTLGYAAFLAGPPLLGFLGDRVGTLHSLLVVAVLLVPTLVVVPAARERRAAPVSPDDR